MRWESSLFLLMRNQKDPFRVRARAVLTTVLARGVTNASLHLTWFWNTLKHFVLHMDFPNDALKQGEQHRRSAVELFHWHIFQLSTCKCCFKTVYKVLRSVQCQGSMLRDNLYGWNLELTLTTWINFMFWKHWDQNNIPSLRVWVTEYCVSLRDFTSFVWVPVGGSVYVHAVDSEPRLCRRHWATWCVVESNGAAGAQTHRGKSWIKESRSEKTSCKLDAFCVIGHFCLVPQNTAGPIMSSSPGLDSVKEIRGFGCHVLRSLEGSDKPYISWSLGLGVRRLFEHEKLARPSDTGHYVVAARLFHRSQAKWDTVLGQSAGSQAWIFTTDRPWGVVIGAAGSTTQRWRPSEWRQKSDQSGGEKDEVRWSRLRSSRTEETLGEKLNQLTVASVSALLDACLYYLWTLGCT